MYSEFFDYVSGSPCMNCESAPADPDDLFCSDGCRDEFHGEGEYEE